MIIGPGISKTHLTKSDWKAPRGELLIFIQIGAMEQLESEALKFSTKADITGSSMYHREYLELGKDKVFFDHFLNCIIV